MRLNKLDFLSNAPKIFIFQKHSNKTHFGGVLTFILFIIILILFAYHLIIFITEEDYSIQYLREEKYLYDKEVISRWIDNRYNPYIEFGLELSSGNKLLSNNYVIFNETDGQIIPRRQNLTKRVTDINIGIYYKCKNQSDADECIPSIDYFMFHFRYIGFKIDHQNSNSPLHYLSGGDLYRADEEIYTNDVSIQTITWENVKYNPEAGISKLLKNIRGIDNEKQKKIGISLRNSNFENLDEDELDLITYFNGTKYRLLRQIKHNIDFFHYDEYTRTKKSFFGFISNVFSLSLAIFKTLSSFLTGFYSNNFDNYKIIEKILHNDKPINKKKPANIELTISNKDDSLLDENNKNINNDDEEENKNFVNENLIYNFETEKEDEEKRIIPKFRFIDFLYNNIYCNTKCNNNKQKIISKCNEIINKYYSIDMILYNQIKMENLLKDYKWNNPDLSNTNNNELIIQLNNLISSYNT